MKRIYIFVSILIYVLYGFVMDAFMYSNIENQFSNSRFIVIESIKKGKSISNIVLDDEILISYYSKQDDYIYFTLQKNDSYLN